MSDSATVEAKMLESLELFHYVNRFQNSLFALIPEDDRNLLELLSDLRVIQDSGIKLITCCRHRVGLPDVIRRLIGYGYEFQYITVPSSGGEAEASEAVSKAFSMNRRPIVAYDGFESRGEDFGDFHRKALSFVCQLDVSKVFFPGRHVGLEIQGKFLSHPTVEEIQIALQEKDEINIGHKNLSFLEQARESYGVELILLQARSGELFREIFTHSGAGTLFSKHYHNVIRVAKASDVRDIFFLMKPYLASGIILSITADEIERDINSYLVYTVDSQIVASARCRAHGKAYELGKLCTLPRYQGRGRARELAERIIEIARQEGMDSVFALTTSPETGVFFESLGFVVVDREVLPAEWKKGYDFSRKSIAYQYDLTATPLL
jgi:N-acetylglutamate synthase-like GNAT family acetyltransferase